MGFRACRADRLYYIGPCSARRPQKGRQRRFHQIGVEVFRRTIYVDAGTVEW
jgi:histidyl-tRNA synthetase